MKVSRCLLRVLFSDGCVCAFNTVTGVYLLRCHTSVVHSVDFTNSVVVSGSRDATVKVSRVFIGQSRSLLVSQGHC